MALLVSVVAIAANANRAKLFAVMVDGEVIGHTDDKDLVGKMVARLSEEESFRIGAEVKVASEMLLRESQMGKRLSSERA